MFRKGRKENNNKITKEKKILPERAGLEEIAKRRFFWQRYSLNLYFYCKEIAVLSL